MSFEQRTWPKLVFAMRLKVVEALPVAGGVVGVVGVPHGIQLTEFHLGGATAFPALSMVKNAAKDHVKARADNG